MDRRDGQTHVPGNRLAAVHAAHDEATARASDGQLDVGCVVLGPASCSRLAVPLLDVSLFRIPAFAGAVGVNTLSIFAFLGLLFFYSQYLQLVRGFGPLKAGVAELPATIASVVVIALIGALVTRLGAGRSIGVGLLTSAIGLAGIGLTASWDSYWGLGVSLAVVGLGIGVSMTVSVDAVVSTVPADRSGAAAAISETGYELGGALGIAILGSLQMAIYRAHLELPGELSATDTATVKDSLASTLARITDPDVLATARESFTWGLQVTALVAGALLLVAAVVAWKIIPARTVTSPGTEVRHHA
ncbi:MFS transporter [Nocardioides sp. SYSU DS0663]|uniref:MFS transporter n=1 Tax=Nocardioides sp. SYSU DS0663 TaxID=3416445 RepID=UPI003F4BAB5B